MSDTVEQEVSGAANQVVRVPRNMLAMIRQSYDTREKVLDWCLAFAVALCLMYVFRDQLSAMISGDDSRGQ